MSISLLLPSIGCFLYFRYVVPYHVCFKEQIQLFVFQPSYLLSYFSKPAAIACLTGDFMTQFLYFKTGGAATVILLFGTLWLLIFKTLKRFFVETELNDMQHAQYLLAGFSLIPVMFEWILFPSLDFSIALSVSFIIALSAFLVYAQIMGKISFVVGIFLIPTLYICAGASVFLFLVLVIFHDVHNRRKQFVYRAAMICFALVTPVVFRHFYFLTIPKAFLFPYQNIMQLTSLIVLSCMVILSVCLKYKFSRIRYCSIAVMIAMYSLLIIALYKTTNIEQEKLFGIVIEARKGEWDKVLKIAESSELQNPVAACYTNIALSQKNLLGERLMDFYQPFSTGLFLPVAPSSTWLTIFLSNDAYYHIGDLGMAQHAALLGMIFSPYQRSAKIVERLAEINIETGDWHVAEKYMRILESTLFYRNIKPDSTQQRSGGSTQRGVFKTNVLRNANDVRTSLELLVEGNPENLPALNYLLCFYLLNKDISAFFNAYTAYWFGKIDYIPKAYAQALLIYFAGTNSTIKDVQEYGIDSETIRSFGEYTRLYEQFDGNLSPMLGTFPNTYWLYFHYAEMISE